MRGSNPLQLVGVALHWVFAKETIMRHLFLILPVSLLLSASAGAQDVITPSTQPESISRVQVMAPTQPFQFRDYEAEAISGGYKMSNGWKMKVDPAADGIVAQIGKRHPMRLVAVSTNQYVTPDGNVAMEFNRGKDGDEMLMSYVPDARTAQVVVVTSTLAQR
jgi:hypothetical protein